MRLWRILLGILPLFGVFVFVAIISSTHAFAHVAHSSVYIENPTPTPNANLTLQMAQQEEVDIQSILSLIGVLLVAVPGAIGLVYGILGYLGFNDFRTFRRQAQELLENTKKQHEETLENITKLQKEATEKQEEIEHTQQALVHQGETLEDLKRQQIEDMKKLQKGANDTQQALVYLALGDRFSNQKDPRQAIDAYKKAGDLLSNDPQINYVLGQIYSGFGYYEEAIQSLEAALAIQQQYPEAEMELGLAYRRRGEYRTGPDADTMRTQDYEKAIEHLQRAIDLRPNYDYALSTLAGLYRRQGEYEKALKYYEAVYRIDPSSSYALGNVASLCWYLGKLDKARQFYMLTELALTEQPLPIHTEVYWDYYDLALAQLALGKAEEAKKSYAKAIGDTPGAVQFDSVLSVLYFLQKAKDPIPGLDEVIQTIEKEKSTRVS